MVDGADDGGGGDDGGELDGLMERTHLDGVKAVWILDRLWGFYLGTEVRYQLYRSDTVAIP